MYDAKHLKEIEEYEGNSQEQQALDEFVKFIENKYSVQVHKAVFRYNEDHSEIDFVDLYLLTTSDEKAVHLSEDEHFWKQQFLEEGRLLCATLKKIVCAFQMLLNEAIICCFGLLRQWRRALVIQ